jgi:hypothetical protein
MIALVKVNMPRANRTAKTLSLERELLRLVEQTKGDASTSERVNQLLKAGLEAESQLSLEREASQFFASEAGKERLERPGFQRASIKSLSRE